MTSISLDTETTGLTNDARVIEVAIVAVEDGRVLMYTRLSIPIPVPEFITGLTGIKDEDLVGKPKFVDVAAKIRDLINASEAIVGSNPAFDKRMLSLEFNRIGVKGVDWPPLVCTSQLWKKHEPRRSLTAAYKRFVGRAGFDGAHGALADSEAARKVFLAQCAEFKIDYSDMSKLNPEQAKWWGGSDHVVWDGDVLTINFGKCKGTPCHMVDKGYYQWLRRQDFPEHVCTLADYILEVAPRCTDVELAEWARSVVV